MTSNEHRISNLEKEAMVLGSRIEELASDTDEGMRVLTEKVDQGFLQANMLMIEIQSTMATKDDINQLRNEMKTDMIAMETRLIDAMKQLLQQKSGE